MRYEKVLVTGAGGLLGRHVVAELKGRCHVSGFDLKRGADDIPFTVGDVLDPAAVARAVEGQDAVVHVAAMPNIWSGTGERIMAVNVMGTWTVMQAAEAAKVRRVVLCSSDSVVGFTVASGRMLPPRWLPVGEDHPLHPTDPYALSKTLGEGIAESFADRGAFSAVALRPVFVLYPEMHGEVVARARDPAGYTGPAAGGPSAAGGGPVWHHVDPRDAARGFRLALELPELRFDRFFLSANVTLAPEPTLERLERYLGFRPELRDAAWFRDNPHAPLYDLRRARDVLGFTAEHDHRGLLAGIAPAPTG